MKIGDIIQIKSPAFYSVGAYHSHLFDEKMLVIDIIDDIVCDIDGFERVVINAIVECVSESGENRFPIEDMEVIDETR